MSTLLATLVGLCFIWSVILFFAAVFMRERAQEDSFGWALAGAVLFFVVFADRLPGEPMQLREAITFLPGVGAGAELFTSSLVALVVLLVVYAFRIGVFVELFIHNDNAEANGKEEVANDIVGAPLSYYCFAICVVALLQPVYALGLLETGVLCVALIVGYYGGILPRLLHFFQNIWTELLVFAARVRWTLERVVLEGIVLLAKGEEFRRGDKSSGFRLRAEARLDKLEEEEEQARIRRGKKIAQAAEGGNKAEPGERASR